MLMIKISSSKYGVEELRKNYIIPVVIVQKIIPLIADLVIEFWI